jgi:hypothetical protein
MLLGLVYCIIQPLMAPIALLYFWLGSPLYKYQLLYVHHPRFESGGKAILSHSQHSEQYLKFEHEKPIWLGVPAL